VAAGVFAAKFRERTVVKAGELVNKPSRRASRAVGAGRNKLNENHKIRSERQALDKWANLWSLNSG
jgi:hypothetical protein